MRQTELFGGMSRGWRRRRCCLAEAAAEVEPEDSDAGAVLRAMGQVSIDCLLAVAIVGRRAEL